MEWLMLKIIVKILNDQASKSQEYREMLVKETWKMHTKISISLAFTIFNITLMRNCIGSGATQSANNDGTSGQSSASTEDSWNFWWSYSGVSGPTYWGLINADWFMCHRGRHQSPVNIATKSLVYDPYLKPLRADNNLISGILLNDGHAIVFNGSLMAQRHITKYEQDKRANDIANNDTKFQSDSKDSNSISKTDNNNGLHKRDVHAIQSALDDDAAAIGGLFYIDDNINNVRSNSQSDAIIVGNLTKSIEMSIKQSNQLESETILKQINDDVAMVEDGLNDGVTEGSLSNNNLDLGTNGGLSELSSNFDDQYTQFESKVLFSGAGLDYVYQFESFYLRFGPANSDSSIAGGSEHRINSRSYSGELQLLAFNTNLYKSYFEASTRPKGLLGIAILIDTLPGNKNAAQQKRHLQVAPTTNSIKGVENSSWGKSGNNTTLPVANEQLDQLIRNNLLSIQHRGGSNYIRGLNISAFLPDTDQFVTYAGSLTQPGCHESVDWLILNKPLYISQDNLDSLRSISADEQSTESTGTLIAGNNRPTQPVNSRPLRTNIKPLERYNGQTREDTCRRLWTRYEYEQSH